MLKYTVINYELRRQFGLDNNAIAVMDVVYKLSTNPEAPVKGWCSAKRGWLCKNLMMERTRLWRIIDKLVAEDLLEEDLDTKNLRTTRKWNVEQPNVVSRTAPEPGSLEEEISLEDVKAEMEAYVKIFTWQVGFIRYAETMGKASVYEEMKDSFILSRMNDKSGENWLKSTNRMYKRWMMYVNNYDVKSTGTAAIDESKFFKNV